VGFAVAQDVQNVDVYLEESPPGIECDYLSADGTEFNFDSKFFDKLIFQELN